MDDLARVAKRWLRQFFRPEPGRHPRPLRLPPPRKARLWTYRLRAEPGGVEEDGGEAVAGEFVEARGDAGGGV
jgi:hypothetical protein